MVKQTLITAGIVCAVLGLFSACLLSPASRSVIIGNTEVSQGRYQDAILAYLAEKGVNADEEDYLNFNLGTVYYNLGEKEGALRIWNKSIDANDLDIRFKIIYNMAFVWYESGNYAKALELLQEASRLNHHDIDTKILLEATWSKLLASRRINSETKLLNTPSSDDPKNLDYGRLYDYVLRKEARIWQDINATDNAKSTSSDY